MTISVAYDESWSMLCEHSAFSSLHCLCTACGAQSQDIERVFSLLLEHGAVLDTNSKQQCPKTTITLC